MVYQMKTMHHCHTCVHQLSVNVVTFDIITSVNETYQTYQNINNQLRSTLTQLRLPETSSMTKFVSLTMWLLSQGHVSSPGRSDSINMHLLVQPLVCSRLNYCTAILAGLLTCDETMQNVAHLVFDQPTRRH